MDLIIKSLAGELEEDEKKLIRKKMLWFEDHLPNSAIMTVGVKQHITKKSNQAFEIIVHINRPEAQNRPIYVRVFRDRLADAIDVSKQKIERIVLRKKEKRQFKLKLPKFKLRRSNENSR